ncbi:hypothetical protein FOXYSP1_09370 [Fusarium oxysporum f. sp. phaseoli]
MRRSASLLWLRHISSASNSCHRSLAMSWPRSTRYPLTQFVRDERAMFMQPAALATCPSAQADAVMHVAPYSSLLSQIIKCFACIPDLACVGLHKSFHTIAEPGASILDPSIVQQAYLP